MQYLYNNIYVIIFQLIHAYYIVWNAIILWAFDDRFTTIEGIPQRNNPPVASYMTANMDIVYIFTIYLYRYIGYFTESVRESGLEEISDFSSRFILYAQGTHTHTHTHTHYTYIIICFLRTGIGEHTFAYRRRSSRPPNSTRNGRLRVNYIIHNIIHYIHIIYIYISTDVYNPSCNWFIHKNVYIYIADQSVGNEYIYLYYMSIYDIYVCACVLYTLYIYRCLDWNCFVYFVVSKIFLE